MCDKLTQLADISIHALREEGDPWPAGSGERLLYFYPRPPRGGRLHMVQFALASGKFLSTPSARRATCYLVLTEYDDGDFYPRPPRGGRRW